MIKGAMIVGVTLYSPASVTKLRNGNEVIVMINGIRLVRLQINAKIKPVTVLAVSSRTDHPGNIKMTIGKPSVKMLINKIAPQSQINNPIIINT